MTALSPAYFAALEKSKAHHASSKTFSGKFLRPHAPFIKELIEQHGVRSILDYGCGKGSQYEWVSHGGDASIPEGMTLESYWGIEVTKYDPAYPPFAAEPVGQFDLVLCTHTLGSIPTVDLPAIVDRIYGLARKAVYFAEKIGKVKKQLFTAATHPLGWSREQWEQLLRSRHPWNVTAILATRERTERGVELLRGEL